MNYSKLYALCCGVCACVRVCVCVCVLCVCMCACMHAFVGFHVTFVIQIVNCVGCLTACQPLQVILCRLPEEGRKGIEKIAERGKRSKEKTKGKVNVSRKTKEMKTCPLSPPAGPPDDPNILEGFKFYLEHKI